MDQFVHFSSLCYSIYKGGGKDSHAEAFAEQFGRQPRPKSGFEKSPEVEMR